MFCQVLALLLTFGSIHIASGGIKSSIPTREDQVNLLTNVGEVLDQLKLLIVDEGKATDESAARDIDLMVRRAQDTLALFEELTFSKLSCTENKVCIWDYKPVIKQLAEDGKLALNSCIESSSKDIYSSSSKATNSTDFAIDVGHNLLASLKSCSSMYGLKLIACYKNIIDTDVIPVKTTILSAINDHRIGHFRAISIRDSANKCVDTNLQFYMAKMAEELQKGLSC